MTYPAEGIDLRGPRERLEKSLYLYELLQKLQVLVKQAVVLVWED